MAFIDVAAEYMRIVPRKLAMVLRLLLCNVRIVFSGENHTRPMPAILPGTVWGITAFFNPCAYRSHLQNYRIFRRSLREQGLPLIAVELAFGEQPFVLQAEDANILVQIRGGDIMWQKERLLNIALQHLPEECDKVVILDNDILFERADWLEQAVQQLEEYMVVFPFAHIVRLSRGAQERGLQRYVHGFGEGRMLHSFGWGFFHYGMAGARLFRKHGVTGGAVAVRRTLLDKHGLYDADITGAGDVIFAQACIGNMHYTRLIRMSPGHRMHAAQWSERVAEDAQRSVGYIDGVILHLWHGSKKTGNTLAAIPYHGSPISIRSRTLLTTRAAHGSGHHAKHSSMRVVHSTSSSGVMMDKKILFVAVAYTHMPCMRSSPLHSFHIHDHAMRTSGAKILFHTRA